MSFFRWRIGKDLNASARERERGKRRRGRMTRSRASEQIRRNASSSLRRISTIFARCNAAKRLDNLSFSANKNRTFVYRQMFCFCLSKPQAWHIIAARSAVHIISPCGAVYHHALACISLRLDDIQTFGLMIYRNKLRMIYTPSA